MALRCGLLLYAGTIFHVSKAMRPVEMSTLQFEAQGGCGQRKSAAAGTELWCRCNVQRRPIVSKDTCEDPNGGRQGLCHWDEELAKCLPITSTSSVDIWSEISEDLNDSNSTTAPSSEPATTNKHWLDSVGSAIGSWVPKFGLGGAGTTTTLPSPTPPESPETTESASSTSVEASEPQASTSDESQPLPSTSQLPSEEEESQQTRSMSISGEDETTTKHWLHTVASYVPTFGLLGTTTTSTPPYKEPEEEESMSRGLLLDTVESISSTSVRGEEEEATTSLSVSEEEEGTTTSLSVSAEEEGTTTSLSVSAEEEGTTTSLSISGEEEGTTTSLSVSGEDEGTTTSLSLSGQEEGTTTSLAEAADVPEETPAVDQIPVDESKEAEVVTGEEWQGEAAHLRGVLADLRATAEKEKARLLTEQEALDSYFEELQKDSTMLEDMARHAVAAAARRLEQKKQALNETQVVKAETQAKKLAEAQTTLKAEMAGESARVSTMASQLSEALANLSALHDANQQSHAKVVKHKATLADQRSTLVQCKVLASGALDNIKHHIDDDLDGLIKKYSQAAADEAESMTKEDMPDLDSDVWPPIE